MDAVALDFLVTQHSSEHHLFIETETFEAVGKIAASEVFSYLRFQPGVRLVEDGGGSGSKHESDSDSLTVGDRRQAARGLTLREKRV